MVRQRLTDVLRRVRNRAPFTVARTARLSVAAVASYVIAHSLVSDPHPVTAALTALLIVQVTLVGTLADTVRRIVSVLVGVGVAITVSAFAGFTWWSLAALVVTSLVLAQALRLGVHAMEVPISAMLILSAGGAGAQATDRVIETLIGAGVGVLLNLLVPPSTRTHSAGEAVEAYARQIARLLERISRTLADAPVSRDQAYEWLREQRAITGSATQVDRVLVETLQSRRLNPRAVGSRNPVPDLRSGLDALEHTAVALRSLLRSIADGAGGAIAGEHGTEESPDDARRRAALADLLADLARCVAAFGLVVRVGDDPGTIGADLEQALDDVRAGQQRLADLMLVDPRDAAALWQLHGSLLAAVDRVLVELDPEELARVRQRRRDELTTRRSAQAAQRLRASARRVAGHPAMRRPRRG